MKFSKMFYKTIFIIGSIIIGTANMGYNWKVAFCSLAIGYMLGDLAYWLEKKI